MSNQIVWVIGPKEKRENFIKLTSSKVQIFEFENFNSEELPVFKNKYSGYNIRTDDFRVPDFIFWFPSPEKMPHESYFDKIEFMLKSELFKRTEFKAVTPIPRIQVKLKNIGIAPMSFQEVLPVIQRL